MKYMLFSSRFVLCALSVSLLTGCDAARRSLGMERKSPEAFSVTDHDALVIPPNFHLRPPLDAATPAPAETADKKAAETAAPADNNNLSPAEKSLLKKAGYQGEKAAAASPVKKPKVEKEMEDSSPLQNLVPKRQDKQKNVKKDDDVLDPDAETKRLAQEGQAPKA